MRFAHRRVHPKRCALGLAVTAAAALVSVAPAAADPRADYALKLASQTPGTPTALTLHILYKNPDDPRGKPPPVRFVDLALPAGTRLVRSAVPPCEASDQELMALGAQACPDSRVGGGAITVMTGLGPPVDPFATDVVILATPTGVIEVVNDRTTGRTIATERLDLQHGHLIAHPAAYPGGPPDGQTSVRRIDDRIAARGYVIAPGRCPADGLWRSRGTFGFADGSKAVVDSTTPCRAGG